MGVNNKQRRAAKRRQRARRQRPSEQPARGGPAAWQPGMGWDPIGAAYAAAELAAYATVRRLSRRKVDEAELRRHAESIERKVAGDRHVLEAVVADLLAQLVDRVVDGGWDPSDLAQLVIRRADSGHLATLAAALHADRRAHSRGVDWQTACDAVGAEVRLRLANTADLASALQVAAVLACAPLLEAGAITAGPATSHPKLAKVRALLAKAESTPYDEEAEALSAKAQELITRYALGRLLDQGSAATKSSDPQVRRIWLDAPYVRAKAALIHGVADANRCRAASADQLGFSVVVGAAADLDAVELLVTSLLVQADAAMLRHARRTAGGSRTRSFRQSFLLAYAARIGERLRTAADEAVSASGADRLLPVLRDHDADIAAAFDAMVPHTAAKGQAITSVEGWSAGTVAADLALLDVNGQLPDVEVG